MAEATVAIGVTLGGIALLIAMYAKSPPQPLTEADMILDNATGDNVDYDKLQTVLDKYRDDLRQSHTVGQNRLDPYILELQTKSVELQNRLDAIAEERSTDANMRSKLLDDIKNHATAQKAIQNALESSKNRETKSLDSIKDLTQKVQDIEGKTSGQPSPESSTLRTDLTKLVTDELMTLKSDIQRIETQSVSKTELDAINQKVQAFVNMDLDVVDHRIATAIDSVKQDFTSAVKDATDRVGDQMNGIKRDLQTLEAKGIDPDLLSSISDRLQGLESLNLGDAQETIVQIQTRLQELSGDVSVLKEDTVNLKADYNGLRESIDKLVGMGVDKATVDELSSRMDKLVEAEAHGSDLSALESALRREIITVQESIGVDIKQLDTSVNKRISDMEDKITALSEAAKEQEAAVATLKAASPWDSSITVLENSLADIRNNLATVKSENMSREDANMNLESIRQLQNKQQQQINLAVASLKEVDERVDATNTIVSQNDSLIQSRVSALETQMQASLVRATEQEASLTALKEARPWDSSITEMETSLTDIRKVLNSVKDGSMSREDVDKNLDAIRQLQDKQQLQINTTTTELKKVDTRVNQSDTRVSALESQIQENLARASVQESMVATLKKERPWDSSITEMETSLTDIRKVLNSVKDRSMSREDVDKNLDAIRQLQDKQQLQIDTTTTELKKVDTRVDQTDARVDQTDARVSALESQIQENLARASVQESMVATLKKERPWDSSITEMETSLADIRKVLDSVKDRSMSREDVDKNLNAIRQLQDKQQLQIDTTTTELKKVDTRVDQTDARVDQTDARVSALDTQIQENLTRASVQESMVATLKKERPWDSSITEMETSLADIRKVLDSVKNGSMSREDVDKNLDAIRQLQDKQQVQIDTTTTDLKKVDTRVDQTDARVSALESQMRATNSRATEQEATISSLKAARPWDTSIALIQSSLAEIRLNLDTVRDGNMNRDDVIRHLDAIRKLQAEQQLQIDSATSGLKTVDKRIDETNVVVKSNTARIDALEKRFTILEHNISDLSRNISVLQQSGEADRNANQELNRLVSELQNSQKEIDIRTTQDVQHLANIVHRLEANYTDIADEFAEVTGYMNDMKKFIDAAKAEELLAEVEAFMQYVDIHLKYSATKDSRAREIGTDHGKEIVLSSIMKWKDTNVYLQSPGTDLGVTRYVFKYLAMCRQLQLKKVFIIHFTESKSFASFAALIRNIRRAAGEIARRGLPFDHDHSLEDWKYYLNDVNLTQTVEYPHIPITGGNSYIFTVSNVSMLCITAFASVCGSLMS